MSSDVLHIAKKQPLNYDVVSSYLTFMHYFSPFLLVDPTK